MSTATIDPKQLQAIIEDAWEKRDTINTATEGPVRTAVQEALAGLDEGAMRVAEKAGKDWTVNQWLKRRCCCPSA
jgi:2,3,4,5-tetrahydropyridine-2-carboxylate N-succinyltransferase